MIDEEEEAFMSSSLRNVVIVDLDGTLCNSGHREHLAQAGQWDDFHGKLEDDEAHEDIVVLLNTLQAAKVTVFACTGRNERYRRKTIDWFARKGVAPDKLMMRPDDDFTPDHILKPQMIEQYFGTHKTATTRVLFVLEDRDKVVEAWRNLGYRCFQVQPGGY